MMQAWRIIGRILKWSGLAAGALVLLALVLFGMAYAINSHDEALTLQVQALLLQPPNPYSDQDNVYLALAGFDAPPGQSPTAAGQARIEHYNQNLDRALRAPPWEMRDVLGPEDPKRLEFIGNFDFSPPNTYWSDIARHRQQVEGLLTDNRELYERYRALHRQRGYFETARPSVAGLSVGVSSPVRKLFLADVVLRMRNDDPNLQQEALADLQSDLRLWRAVLTGEGGLISKMVAMAYLHRDEAVLADMIADPHAPVPMGAAEAELIAPLFTLADWDLASAYRTEFRVQESMLQQLRDSVESHRPVAEEGTVHRWLDRISNHFFKCNATENLFAQRALELMRAAAPGAKPQTPANPFWTLTWIYNPGGKMLLFISAGTSPRYGARAWDEAAFQRLVRLSYEIRRQRIGPAGIPAFMREHPEWSTHPDDGRPFLWDEQEGVLRVQNRVAGSPPETAFLVQVWKAPPGG